MRNPLLNISLLGALAVAIVATPWPASAQDSGDKAPASPEQSAPAKHKNRKHESMVFNGKVTAVDKDAMTLTVGKRTFEINSETKITKNETPATLSDITVGEKVGGAYKNGADGKLIATTVHIGSKADGEKKHKKKNKEESSDGGGTEK